MIVDKIVKEWDGVDLERKKIMVEEFLDAEIEKLDRQIAETAVFYIKKNLLSETECQIQEEFERHGVVWFTRHHYGFGMKVRNMLRDLVCDDEDLPTGNWEDYYSALVEVAIGLRKMDGVHI